MGSGGVRDPPGIAFWSCWRCEGCAACGTAPSSPQISFPSAAGNVCTTKPQLLGLLMLIMMLLSIIVVLIGKGRVATTIPPLYTELSVPPAAGL